MNRLFLKGLPIFIIGMLITISCADDPLKVGIELLPNEDRFEAISDTMAINCFTVDQSFPSYSTKTSSESVSSTDVCPLGHTIDPLFGQTWAQLFTYFEKGVDFYGSDSIYATDVFEECAIYFNIEGSDVYGELGGFDIIAHPLTKPVRYGAEPGDPPTNYLVKSDLFPFNEEPISLSTEYALNNPESEIPVLDSGNYIFVRLDDSFGQMLMDTSLTNSSVYDDNFPGFYLYGEAKTGSIGGFHSLFYKQSKLLVKFTRPNGTKDGLSDTTIYAYHELANYQGFYKHDYNNAPIKDAIGSTEEDQNFYVQAMDGVKGLIDLVELDSFRTENMDKIGINLAELVFPMSPRDDTSTFFFPKRIATYNFERDDYYGIFTLDDIRSDNPMYFNGYFNSDTYEYRINITETVHRYMQGDWDQNKFYLNVANYSFDNTSSIDYKTPGRLVLNSGSHATKPAYLRLIYTLTNY